VLVLSRHSNATLRTIIDRRMRKSGREKPSTSVAYDSGKAAKAAPPATSSQTWSPSQTGPIDLTRTRRSASFRARKGNSMPTPKSNPSSTK
jgi:hypothetical protein